jgi:hypothetical protein
VGWAWRGLLPHYRNYAGLSAFVIVERRYACYRYLVAKNFLRHDCGLDNEAETFLGLDFAFCGSVRIGSEERMKVGF